MTWQELSQKEMIVGGSRIKNKKNGLENIWKILGKNRDNFKQVQCMYTYWVSSLVLEIGQYVFMNIFMFIAKWLIFISSSSGRLMLKHR